MALIDCPECAEPLSDAAYVCPHCGYPTEKQRRLAFSWTKTLGIWVVLIVFFLLLWQFISPRP